MNAPLRRQARLTVILAIVVVVGSALARWLRTRAPAGDEGPALTAAERVWLTIHRGLDRYLSPLGVAVYRRTRGEITRPWHVDALLLTTHGRRSGRARTVVLQWFPDGEAMVVAAANDGGASHPGWYHNLRADPAASVEAMDRTVAVRAEELTGPAADGWWAQIVQHDPSYERYARATERRIPIVRLVPVADPAHGQAAEPAGESAASPAFAPVEAV